MCTDIQREISIFIAKSERRVLCKYAVPKLNLPAASHTRIGNIQQNKSRSERFLRRTAKKNVLVSSTPNELTTETESSTMSAKLTFQTSDSPNMQPSGSSCVAGQSAIVSLDDFENNDEIFERFLQGHDQCLHESNDAPGVLKCDQCIQVNTLHDLIPYRFKVMDLLSSETWLNSWTGIPTYALLHCIEDCVSVGYPEEITNHELTLLERIILCFIKMKTNLSFACMTSIFDN